MKAAIFFTATSFLAGVYISENVFAEQRTESTTPQQLKVSADTTDNCYQELECYSVAVGSADVDSSRLRLYHAKWTQSVPQDGEWVKTPSIFEERLEVAENGHWKHTQINPPGDGTNIIGIRTLDRQTLQVLDEEIEFENKPAEHPTRLFYDLTGDQFVSQTTFANGETKQGEPQALAMPMFDGQILGVALSALPLRQGYTATLPALLAHSSSSYWVEAQVTDRKQFATADGGTQDVWEVSTKWVDHNSGGVSAGGRDEAGGAYYITVNPVEGVPRVIEYANNGVRITWDGIHRNI